MTTTTRAAVLRTPGEPLTVEEVELDPPQRGELRIRVEAAGVCHTDYHYMTGDMTCRLPSVLGHEGAGVVEEVGPGGRSGVQPGDRVAMLWRPHCGACPACLAGNPVLCRLGRVQAQTGGLPDGTSRIRRGSETLHHFLGVSCFADQVVVSEDAVVPVPDGVPAEIAAISSCAVITGLGAALNAVRDAAGRPLVVLGAGGVGVSAILGARLIGADPVIAIDVDQRRLDAARRLGADIVINAGDADPVEQVLDLTGGGAPWVIEAVGRPPTLQQALAMLSPRGSLVMVGLGAVDATFAVPVNLLVQQQRSIIGSLYGSSNPFVDLPRIFALYADGKLPLDDLIGERMRLDQVNDAYAGLVGGAVGRTILRP
ncbi:zinc-binding dehydrogenase [Microlunatus soli]|uniref:S-(Hydroxymethyl)glutathione dehydrogenase / alcohol dehydrogenase n=1 Tax=Microlunatus soli TaxID=630515 RepID=A0A1H1T8W6_9ACTN|nr:zinc-binding dehydrogenase [Microlunatus soli]SDS56039.1 S-(hydroxymethyl)glutathione dehydrogenase / alcohol dehydrogenase [Microlunatus soli]